MARHSFIQMSKLSDVRGRINYITSPVRQENLYATYRTRDSRLWSDLARENQEDFHRSGAAGKCIEARELIIALQEEFVHMQPQEVLRDFTEYFKNMFYNEQGKHVRTKKEILDENGELRTGCRVIQKGEVYEKIDVREKVCQIQI